MANDVRHKPERHKGKKHGKRKFTGKRQLGYIFERVAFQVSR